MAPVWIHHWYHTDGHRIVIWYLYKSLPLKHVQSDSEWPILSQLTRYWLHLWWGSFSPIYSSSAARCWSINWTSYPRWSERRSLWPVCVQYSVFCTFYPPNFPMYSQYETLLRFLWFLFAILRLGTFGRSLFIGISWWKYTVCIGAGWIVLPITTGLVGEGRWWAPFVLFGVALSVCIMYDTPSSFVFFIGKSHGIRNVLPDSALCIDLLI